MLYIKKDTFFENIWEFNAYSLYFLAMSLTISSGDTELIFQNFVFQTYMQVV